MLERNLSFSGFSLFLLFSALYINTNDTEIMTEQIWNYELNRNMKITQNMYYILLFSKLLIVQKSYI